LEGPTGETSEATGKGKGCKKPEVDKHGFNKVLKDDNTPFNNNQNLFQGFSFTNYGVKRGDIC
jgi:hypothetical protein